MKIINFASNEDILDVSTNDKKSGIPFKLNNETRVLNNNYHTLIIEEDTNQKYDKIICPLIDQINLSNESFIINSKSKKLYDEYSSSLKENGYQVICLNFADPVDSDSFNILELAYQLYKSGNYDKAVSIIKNIGYYIFNDNSKKLDSFWSNSATDLFVGTTLYLFEKEDKIDLNMIRHSAETLKLEDIDKNSIMYNFLSGVLGAPNDTKGGIIATFNQKFNLIATKETLCKILSNSSFDLKSILNEKTAIFMVEGTTVVSKILIPLFINQIYYLCNIYVNNNRINLILNDFDELYQIRNIESIISLFTDYNVVLTTFIKNFKCLDDVYGKDCVSFLKIYFKNLIYLYSDDISTLEYISKLCGSNENISDLRNIKDNEALYIIARSLPFIVNI